MRLNVPYFFQERNITCGVAALRMVLGYYDDHVTEKELLKEIPLHSFGTLATDLATVSLQRGYKVSCYSSYLPHFASLKLLLGTRLTIDHLNKIKVSAHANMVVKSWQKYLLFGGELIYEIPKISQLTMSLNQKIPGIISVNTALLGYFHRHWDNGHVLVVNGMNSKKFEVIDPDNFDKEYNYKIDKSLFFTAWTINAIRSSSYLILINK